MGKLPTQTYFDIAANKVDAELLRQRLKLVNLEAKRHIKERHFHAEEFFKSKGLDIGKIREHSAKLIGTGALTGALLFNLPTELKLLPPSYEILQKFATAGSSTENSKEILVDTLSSSLPGRVRPLSRTEEKLLEQVFQNVIGVPARATLESEHLNTTYGIIGIEQHLRRFPGDRLQDHGGNKVIREGMAPGLSAWGYFAQSKQALTKELEDTEKWYAVVQTLYLSDWDRRQPYLKNWYKYRKVLIVNTENGNAVIASIADSGPAAWTGKHYGGSPEVMQSLGGSAYKKGPVIIFFVDDPENEVPLGPVEYNNLDIAMLRN